jgi:hypothetical protein
MCTLLFYGKKLDSKTNHGLAPILSKRRYFVLIPLAKTEVKESKTDNQNSLVFSLEIMRDVKSI